MKIIVGLGNPGSAYEHTRHNTGFMALDSARDLWGENERFGNWSFVKKFNAQISEGKIGHRKIILLKPQTFMNESGISVKAALFFYKIKTSDCIIAYDDIDLPFGSIRLRLGGSSGGHKGIQSIIQQIGTENVSRLRIGINPNHRKVPDAKTFVLKKFSKEEHQKLREIFKNCEQALAMACTDSFSKAMNLYNS